MEDMLYEYLRHNQNLGRSASDALPVEELPGHSSFRGFVPSSRPPSSGFFLSPSSQPGPMEGAGDVQVTVLSQRSGWLTDFLRELDAASPGMQVATGGISGWASGYVFGKIGKFAAIAVGGSILLLQIAHYQGLVQINWTNVERSFQTTRRHLNDRMLENIPRIFENMREFGRRHIFLAGSFCAGFLVGLAT